MKIPQHKKTEPNALDRLFNVTVNDRQFQKMLRKQAEIVRREAFREDMSEDKARKFIHEALTKWVYTSGFSGRQTHKSVGKAVSRVMRGYYAEHVAFYKNVIAEQREIERSGDKSDRYLAGCHADELAEKIREREVGINRPRYWMTL